MGQICQAIANNSIQQILTKQKDTKHSNVTVVLHILVKIDIKATSADSWSVIMIIYDVTNGHAKLVR